MNFGRYRVEQKLGEGPRGEVYRAFDAESARGLPGVRTGPQGTVALKVLHAAFSQDPRLEKQCLDLVHALRLLPQPEVARLISAGKLPEGRLFLVSEYVPGQSLAEVLADQRPLPLAQALHIAQTLATALSAAHQKGLAHLALKPSNVILLGTSESKLAGPRVKLLDLGVARLIPPAIEERQVHRYLAPEQSAGAPPPPPPGVRPAHLSTPVDVYALGVLLYEMLTGRPLEARGRPLSGAGGKAMSIPPLGQLIPVLPKDLLQLNQSMLARDPSQRPTMSEVGVRLAQLEEDLLIGQDIGSYKVLERIAQGGMGTVFKAINQQIGRQAAIKVMRPQFAQMSEVTKRFLNEARAVNLIRHPSLVEIYEFGQLHNGRPYLVMEFLDGQSLSQRRAARGGKLPEADAVSLMRQVAMGVAATHEKAIIHRDLKPENIMIVPDPVAPGGNRVKLLDFGIAKVTPLLHDTDSTQVNTHVGSLVGTPNYMAPEQFSGAGAVTEKTDVYAVGVMLYELLAGRRPYEQVGLMSMSEPPTPLRQIAPLVSERTAALVEGMLAFRPVDRPTMAEVAQQLQGGAEPSDLMDLSEDIGEDKTEQGPPPLQIIQSVSRPPRPPVGSLGAGGHVATPVMPPPIPSGPAGPPAIPMSPSASTAPPPPTPSQASVPVVTKPPEPPPEVIRPLDAPPGAPRRTSGQAPRVEDARMTGVLPRAGQQAGHPWLAFLGGALVALLGVGLWATRKPPQQPTQPQGQAITATPQVPAPVAKDTPQPAAKDPPPAKTPTPVAPAPASVPAEDPAAARAEAVAALREGLGAADAAVRRQAVRLLALRGVEGAAQLIAPLLADRDTKVQREAAEALAQLGDKGALPGLATLVEKTLDAHTFIAAADALDRLGDPRGRARLQEALQARAADVRAHGAALLVARGDAAAREALGRALAGGVPADLRVRGLLQQGAEGIDGLVKLSTTGGGEARLLAAQGLARLGDPRGKAALQQAAGKAGPQQVAAAQALAEAGGQGGCPLLREAVGANRPDAERARAAAGLAGCGPGDRQQLRALLKDRAQGVRVAAAGALLAK